MPFNDVDAIPYRNTLSCDSADSRVYQSLSWLMVNSESEQEYRKYLEAIIAYLVSIEHIPTIENWDCSVLNDKIVDTHVKLAIKNMGVCNV